MTTTPEYYYALGYALDDMVPYAASAGASNSVTITSWISGDTNASTGRNNGAWIYNATQFYQARARNNGLTIASGLQLVDPAWNAPVATNVMVVTHLFPIRGITGDTSYYNIINRALAWYLCPDQLSVTIVPGQQSYSLGAVSYWLDRDERFGHPETIMPDGSRRPKSKLLEPGPTGGLSIPADWRRPSLRIDGGNTYLEIESPFATGTSGSMTLNVMRPAHTLIGGVEVTTGVIAETSAAIPSAEDLLPIMVWEAVKDLSARGVTSATGRWSDRLQDAERAAREVRYFDVSRLRREPQAAPAGAVG